MCRAWVIQRGCGGISRRWSLRVPRTSGGRFGETCIREKLDRWQGDTSECGGGYADAAAANNNEATAIATGSGSKAEVGPAPPPTCIPGPQGRAIVRSTYGNCGP